MMNMYFSFYNFVIIVMLLIIIGSAISTFSQSSGGENAKIPPRREYIEKPYDRPHQAKQATTMMGYYCTSCGAANNKTATYCNSCGSYIIAGEN